MKLGKILYGGFLFFCLSLTFAQPYIASEGFGRPFAFASSQTTADTLIVSEASGVYAYWRNREGLYRHAVNKVKQATETLLDTQGIREFKVESYAGEVALLSIIQDRSTGRTEHRLRWKNEEKTVLETLAPLSMALAVGEHGPLLAYSQIIDSVDHLFLWSWADGAREIYQSGLSLEKIDLAIDGQGVVYLSWLEGSRDRAAVGFSKANWSVYYLSLDGQSSSQPILLSTASNRGIQYQTKLIPTPDAIYLAWRGENEGLNLQQMGGQPIRLEPGYPIGIAEGYFYWSTGASIKRLELANPEQTANVIWAPSPIELADLTLHEGHTFLVWYGGATSKFQLYSANNLQAAHLGWQDKLAKVLQLNPYGLWQGIGSRIFLSLLTGILLSLGFTPVYWLLSLFGAKLFRHGQAKFGGIILAWVGILALMVLAIFRSSTPLRAFHFLTILLSLVLASLITWLRLRNLDTEDQPSIFLGSVLTTLISIVLLSFIHFQTWIEPFMSGF